MELMTCISSLLFGSSTRIQWKLPSLRTSQPITEPARVPRTRHVQGWNRSGIASKKQSNWSTRKEQDREYQSTACKITLRLLDAFRQPRDGHAGIGGHALPKPSEVEWAPASSCLASWPLCDDRVVGLMSCLPPARAFLPPGFNQGYARARIAGLSYPYGLLFHRVLGTYRHITAIAAPTEELP
eukprot:747773-Hanusia_phi.AAC.3